MMLVYVDVNVCGMYSFVCVVYSMYLLFFFKQKTAYEMRISDWSSDVCSSDLNPIPFLAGAETTRLPGEKSSPQLACKGHLSSAQQYDKLTVRFGKFIVQSPALLFHPLRSRLPPSRSLLLQRKTLMTTHPLRKIGRCVLWFSPVVIVVIGFLAAIPWLKQQNDTIDRKG